VSAFQGVKLLKAFSWEPRKVVLEVELEVDVRKQSVRGVVQLPHGVGGSEDEKLLVFCADGEADAMIAAGADYAGVTEMIGRIQKGWLGFDRVLATANVMPKILGIAKILGPKKLMPNPKSGTIVTDLKAAIKEVKAGGTVEFRADDRGICSVLIARTHFSDTDILDNVKFFVREILKHRPRTAAAAPASSGSAVWLRAARLKTEQLEIALDVDKIHPNGAGYFR
jgi:large subunit ribosomal protein L1